MRPWLREGARSSPREEAHAAARQAAQQVADMVAPGIGPGAAWKLVDGEPTRASAAVGTLEGEATAAYRSLVREVARHGGHSGIAALLAARTVLHTLDAPGSLAQRLQGVLLARRQLMGWLQGEARPASPLQAMQAVAGEAAQTLMLGLALDAHDLDAIDVRPGTGLAWLPGVVLEPRAQPAQRELTGAVAVVGRLVDAGRQRPNLRTGDPSQLAALRAAEARRRRDLRDLLRHLGVAVVVCREGDADVAQELAGDGMLVVTDAPLDLVRRVSLATGARAVARPEDLEGALGHGHATRRPARRGGWSLRGAGSAATLEVPGQGPGAALHVAQAEGWLRAAAPVLADPRVVDGGGRWQRAAARSLRRSADHAMGAAPMGIGAVARALDDVADAVVRNSGQDPTRVPTLAGQDDAYACVRVAASAALETAVQVLRIDGVFSKRPSQPEDLRGNRGPAGSPRHMPGDVPPLM